jgi:hypothetical protein
LPGGHGIDPIEKVHRLAHHNRVNEHRNADGLLHGDINEQYGTRNGNGSAAVQYAQRLRQSQVQHIPRSRANIRLNRQIYAETVDEKAGRGQQHVQQNRDRGTVPPEKIMVQHIAPHW